MWKQFVKKCDKTFLQAGGHSVPLLFDADFFREESIVKMGVQASLRQSVTLTATAAVFSLMKEREMYSLVDNVEVSNISFA